MKNHHGNFLNTLPAVTLVELPIPSRERPHGGILMRATAAILVSALVGVLYWLL